MATVEKKTVVSNTTSTSTTPVTGKLSRNKGHKFSTLSGGQGGDTASTSSTAPSQYSSQSGKPKFVQYYSRDYCQHNFIVLVPRQINPGDLANIAPRVAFTLRIQELIMPAKTTRNRMIIKKNHPNVAVMATHRILIGEVKLLFRLQFLA